MSIQSVGFIGAGRVARILLGGWKRSGQMPSRCVLFDPNPEASKSAQSIQPGIEVATDPAQAAAQDIIFLALHPPVLKDGIAPLKAALKDDSILVSLAPKFTILMLSTILDGFDRIARIIPNAPSLVGHGYNPVSFSPALKPDDKAAIKLMFAALGECPEVEERHLEAYAILSAMGPTYFWPQLYALKSIGQSFGLTGEATMEALDKMLWGAVATMKTANLSPDQVYDLIPVKPMAEEVDSLASAYSQKLNALIEKIRPPEKAASV